MRKTGLGGLLFVIANLAWGQQFGATPQEQAMCQVKIYAGRDTSDSGNWQHMHHYCDCLRFTDRAATARGDKNDFKYNLQLAIEGCDYIFSHSTPDFYMRPEVHVSKGRALRLAGRDAEASMEFSKARQLNPNYAPAYNELASLYIRQGNKKTALEVVTDGLRHIAGSKSLQRRYLELGGKLPYPVPEQSPDTAAKAEETAPSDAPAQGTASPAPSETQTNAQTGAESASGTSAETAPKIGSPANPWCRFCPPPELQQPSQSPATP
ncbi:MAG: tetratricopeptide repeat protein [Gammaproteobacteria bacterium]|nr:tetratricopeptide repeat protein [Gammaproteobacteria bacterium]